MNEQQLFDKINKEAERNVPDMYGKIMRSAKAEGLLEGSSGSSAPRTVKSSPNSGGGAVSSNMKKRLITIAAIATVFIALAAVIVLGISKIDFTDGSIDKGNTEIVAPNDYPPVNSGNGGNTNQGGSTSGNDNAGDQNQGGTTFSNCADGHQLTHVGRVEANCTSAGNVEYWYCSDCGKHYSDGNGANEITNTVLPAGHQLTHVVRVEANCTNAGNVEYWYCSDCGKHYSDGNGANEITNTVLPAGHNMTYTARVEANCTNTGNIEYWYCRVCNKYFSDAYGNNEVTLANTVIATNNQHSYYAAWMSDDDYHWHAASCGHNVESAKEAHTLVNNKCTVCGKIVDNGNSGGSTENQWVGLVANANILPVLTYTEFVNDSINEGHLDLVLGNDDGPSVNYPDYWYQLSNFEVKIIAFDGKNLDSLRYELTANYCQGYDWFKESVEIESIEKYPPQFEGNETVKGFRLNGAIYTRNYKVDLTLTMVPVVTFENGNLTFDFELYLYNSTVKEYDDVDNIFNDHLDDLDIHMLLEIIMYEGLGTNHVIDFSCGSYHVIGRLDQPIRFKIK